MIAAQIREAQFQAAWYYSLIIAAMFALMCVGGGWAIRGGVRIWRNGDPGTGLIITAAAVGTMLALTGMLVAGAYGVFSTQGQG